MTHDLTSARAHFQKLGKTKPAKKDEIVVPDGARVTYSLVSDGIQVVYQRRDDLDATKARTVQGTTISPVLPDEKAAAEWLALEVAR